LHHECGAAVDGEHLRPPCALHDLQLLLGASLKLGEGLNVGEVDHRSRAPLGKLTVNSMLKWPRHGWKGPHHWRHLRIMLFGLIDRISHSARGKQAKHGHSPLLDDRRRSRPRGRTSALSLDTPPCGGTRDERE